MLLNAFIKKDPLIMTSSVSEFKPILDKCSWANTWILHIAWIFQKINCERISLWIWHIKTSKRSGLAGSSTKQMAFAECTSMQWCLHESRVSGAVSFPHKCSGKGDFILTLHLWLQRAVRLDKWIKMITQPVSDFSQCIYWREPCRDVRRMVGWSRFLERVSVEPFSFASLIILGKELGCKMMLKISVA